MNQGRSQSGSSEHAKSVVETWCDKISKHRKNCGCFVSEAWSEKIVTKTTKRPSGIQSAKIVISGSQNCEIVFLLQEREHLIMVILCEWGCWTWIWNFSMIFAEGCVNLVCKIILLLFLRFYEHFSFLCFFRNLIAQNIDAHTNHVFTNHSTKRLPPKRYIYIYILYPIYL